MDLRIQRTKTAIREAFIELRKKRPIEKITVTELAKQAGINKATFYLHYSDIFALSDDIEDALIDEIILNLSALDTFFVDPHKAAMELFEAFMENRSRLKELFSGSRYPLFAAKIEQRFKAQLYTKYPDFNTRENDIILTFILQGIFHTIASLRDDECQDVYSIISRIVGDVLKKLHIDNNIPHH